MEVEPKITSSKWRWILLGFLLGLLVSIHSCSCVHASCEPVRNMEDIHAASCRVFAMDANGRGAIGTGTICGLINGKYYVLTNWHVVESHKSVVLQFFGNGRIVECKGTVTATWHNETQPYDFAIITIDQKQLSHYDPPFVPLAQRGTRPTTGGMILSSGCSEGRWSLAWKGSVESYYGQTAQFFPAPKGGQSGSAIIERINGQYYITGILTWRVGDERQLSEEEMRGGAIPICKLYEAFDGKYKTGLPDSIPPNAVWCRIESGSGEQDKSEKSESKEKTRKSDSKAEAKDEAVLRITPEENAKSKTQETPIPKNIPTPRSSIRPMTYAIGNTEEFEAPVAKKDIVEMLYFTSEYCIPCQKAKPVVAEFVKKGHVIYTLNIDTEEGRKEALSRKVTSTPTFIAYRSSDNRKTWTEISRFTGVANLSERLSQAFSLGNSGGDSWRSEPQTNPDSGSIAPLIDEYGSGWRGFRFRERPDDTLPDSGDGESGLFRSDQGIIQKILKSFLKAVLFQAAFMITIFWFIMYGLICLLRKLSEYIPHIKLQMERKTKDSTEP